MADKTQEKKIRCPACGGDAAWDENPHRPFCSEKCKGRDLGNWASEKYRIAGDHSPDSTPKEEE